MDGNDFRCCGSPQEHPSIQRAALTEMAQLVPMLPKDGGDWGNERQELEKLEPAFGRRS